MKLALHPTRPYRSLDEATRIKRDLAALDERREGLLARQRHIEGESPVSFWGGMVFGGGSFSVDQSNAMYFALHLFWVAHVLQGLALRWVLS